MRTRWLILAALPILITAGGAGFRLWPRTLTIRPTVLVPGWERAGNCDTVTLPGRYPVAEIARYHDEFFAYLMWHYFRGLRQFQGSEVLITYSKAGGEISYPIQLRLPDNLLAAEFLLADARARGVTDRQDWRYLTKDALGDLRYQTQLLLTAYSLPASRKLESLNTAQLTAYIRRFVRFKSLTDPRIRGGAGAPPQPLTSDEAHQLAEDIVAVANFYDLPLDFFLGIGAMENNYMNVEGDLQHAIWKRRAEKGDVVLKRKRGRVLVVNSSLGVWQITRATLHYAHRLYLKDKRDYSLLPERLRPSKEVDPNSVQPEVLTTYAGLLFRDLLDRCHGDVLQAVGAYNGGLRKPNPRYAEGVQMVADYARRIMEHAAVLNGPAAGQRFLSATP